jgi:hypothetical protein
MNDRNIALVESDVRRLIERTRGVDSVPAEARARVLARVESVVSASGADIRRAGSGGRASGLRDWMRRLSPYVTTFVVGAATGAMAMRQGARMRSVATHESTSLDRGANIERSAPPVALAQGGPEPLQDTGESDVAPTASSPSSRPTPFEGWGASARGAAISEERALLDIARAALEREDGSAALGATREHERRFPNGVLVQEREAMVIRALVMMGDTKGALARAGRFRERYPDSMLLPAVDSFLRSEVRTPK